MVTKVNLSIYVCKVYNGIDKLLVNGVSLQKVRNFVVRAVWACFSGKTDCFLKCEKLYAKKVSVSPLAMSTVHFISLGQTEFGDKVCKVRACMHDRLYEINYQL